MAHPKRKISSQRKHKRRTHYKAENATLSKCSTTGAVHRMHRAYWVEGSLYYKGKLVIEKEQAE
ncbi:MAG: 50S ribosomal protein L32 [Bacteroidales bacterium]|nr:50S ribosomal protein L32 [Bacteroidales bacterium]